MDVEQFLKHRIEKEAIFDLIDEQDTLRSLEIVCDYMDNSGKGSNLSKLSTAIEYRDVVSQLVTSIYLYKRMKSATDLYAESMPIEEYDEMRKHQNGILHALFNDCLEKVINDS